MLNPLLVFLIFLVLLLGSSKVSAHQKTISGSAGISYKFTHVDEPVMFTTKREENKELDEGKETIKQKGQNGVKDVEYKVKYVNGSEAGREKVGEKTKTQPVEEIISVGIKQAEEAPPEADPMKAFKTFGVIVLLGTAGMAFAMYRNSKPKPKA